jgi:hypothetical protein
MDVCITGIHRSGGNDEVQFHLSGISCGRLRSGAVFYGCGADVSKSKKAQDVGTFQGSVTNRKN